MCSALLTHLSHVRSFFSQMFIIPSVRCSVPALLPDPPLHRLDPSCSGCYYFPSSFHFVLSVSDVVDQMCLSSALLSKHLCSTLLFFPLLSCSSSCVSFLLILLVAVCLLLSSLSLSLSLGPSLSLSLSIGLSLSLVLMSFDLFSPLSLGPSLSLSLSLSVSVLLALLLSLSASLLSVGAGAGAEAGGRSDAHGQGGGGPCLPAPPFRNHCSPTPAPCPAGGEHHLNITVCPPRMIGQRSTDPHPGVGWEGWGGWGGLGVLGEGGGAGLGWGGWGGWGGVGGLGTLGGGLCRCFLRHRMRPQTRRPLRPPPPPTPRSPSRCRTKCGRSRPTVFPPRCYTGVFML